MTGVGQARSLGALRAGPLRPPGDTPSAARIGSTSVQVECPPIPPNCPASAPRRNRRESGFALLMVFVLAAVIAISLYFELPRAMFEHTRQKEQLLIDRGEQYSLAIRRFYVKFGRWPARMEELESTNNMRFLRRQYKDPMTGEADWRIIHEAAGVLTDSLVHPPNPLATGQNGPGGSPTSFGTLTSSLPSGSPLSSPSSADATSDQPVQKALGMLSRPSDRGPLGTAHGGVSADDDTGQPAYASNAPGASSPNPAGDASSANPVAAAPTGQDLNAANPTAGAGGLGPPGSTGPNSVVDLINQQLRGPRQLPGTASSQSQGAGGQTLTGGGIGIAGVASRSELRGIKRYNDRTKYKEWEFVFDMSKLQQLQNPQQQQLQQQPQPQPQPQQTQQPQPGSGASPVVNGNGP